MTAPRARRPWRCAFAVRSFRPRILRLGPGRFRIIWEDDLVLPDSGDRAADIAEVMTRVNAVVERWVRAEPQSWLWLHRRWVDSGRE